jgi:RNA polymerase sigma-B factor
MSSPPSLSDDLVIAHLDLADALARRYGAHGIDAEEIRQVARLGLVTAARRFRRADGVDFVAFAVPTILSELKRHFREHAWSVR